MNSADSPSPRHIGFIPIRKSDLIDLVCSDPAVPHEQREDFHQLCHRLAKHFHDEYHGHAERLKDGYAPFNPDADTQTLKEVSAEDKQRRLDQFFEDVHWMMERANFVALGPEVLEEALKSSSDWGLSMEVDLDVFERYALFARGDIMGKRPKPSWWPWGRPRDKEVPIYQRLVLVMKLKPHPRLGPNADTESIHVKAFKDIPKMDLEMLLPGARVQFSKFDQGMITFPMLTAVAITLWTFLKPMIFALIAGYASRELAELVGANEPQQKGAGFAGAMLGLAAIAFGYSYRTWFTYSHRKTSYSLKLTESLYYQNLVNNAGVLTWLTNEVEEQETREALLAYFILWIHADPDGLSQKQLDDLTEKFLRERAGVDTDFEVNDALAKVERLGLATRNGQLCWARPLTDALTLLGRK